MDKSVNLPPKGSRVFVGLSGGVDSAVTAALLKEAGYDVTGVFIKGWYPPGMPCTWRDDRRDAMRVAAHLRLPFVTLDASEAYKSGVIDYLLREYKSGRTPNPDIMCNKEVKFGVFHAFAKKVGAVIATGHYAQSLYDKGAARLARGLDPDKDQSYFLWAISRASLSDTYFPLGGMHKKDVRKLAEKFGLPNAKKRDSQGICFLGAISVDDFLAKEFGTEPGEALDVHGTVVGMHAGALLSTIGQRIHLDSAAQGPWYVLAKDIPANTLTIAKEKDAAARNRFSLENTNWLQDPDSEKAYTAQYRYHGPYIRGGFDVLSNSFIPDNVVTEPVASGQSLVLFDGDVCIGGGIII